jgi:hypothetical protein
VPQAHLLCQFEPQWLGRRPDPWPAWPEARHQVCSLAPQGVHGMVKQPLVVTLCACRCIFVAPCAVSCCAGLCIFTRGTKQGC